MSTGIVVYKKVKGQEHNGIKGKEDKDDGIKPKVSKLSFAKTIGLLVIKKQGHYNYDEIIGHLGIRLKIADTNGCKHKVLKKFCNYK